MAKAKLNFKWKKGWDIVEVAKGGYAETTYEYFERIRDGYLLKAKAADVWHIGYLRKGEKPFECDLFYTETAARQAFDGVKAFIESELASRDRFEGMSVDELLKWINEYGKNPFMGRSVYWHTAVHLVISKMKEQEGSIEM